MYRLEGDGSYRNTYVWKDGVKISYKCCSFQINPDECVANVDGVIGTIDRMLISAIYLIISEGKFANSRVIFCDEMLRGVQRIVGKIEEKQHPTLTIETILLPNIVEVPPVNVDERLVTFAEETRKK